MRKRLLPFTKKLHSFVRLTTLIIAVARRPRFAAFDLVWWLRSLLRVSVKIWNFCLVTPYVFVEITFLCESQVAAILIFERTNEWSLLRVNSEMVVEIMPLSKVQLTTRMIALQYFQVSMCFGVLELKYSERSCWGHMVIGLFLIGFYSRHVFANILSLDDLHVFAVQWNLLLNRFVFNVIPKNLLSQDVLGFWFRAFKWVIDLDVCGIVSTAAIFLLALKVWLIAKFSETVSIT